MGGVELINFSCKNNDYTEQDSYLTGSLV
jgi:hypothetical protein